MKILMPKLVVASSVAVGLAVGFVGPSFAQQYDAPYLVYEKKNKDKWAAEDNQVNEKLAALEKKFGKKPNIIMVLTDDIGWGVLGVYGGGKVVGTPTPKLDKMAREGMKFLSAYSEPSCTPDPPPLNWSTLICLESRRIGYGEEELQA